MRTVPPMTKLYTPKPVKPAEINEQSLSDAIEEKRRLQSAARLHWVHWFVVAASLAITFWAYNMAQHQVETKMEARFTQQANQVMDLVRERMAKYEEALWAGVAAVQANGGRTDLAFWRPFAENLNIQETYPGINGLGVIYYLPNQAALQRHEAMIGKEVPGFKAFPQHDNTEFFPITYIEPLATNYKAVGLDMAHEINRYTAAKKARDTGTAQITGPIILVQDSERTPGFLFYTPFYKGGKINLSSVAVRKKRLTGLVYAPFVMHKLMEGTLAKANRQVGLKITDMGDGTELYNEYEAGQVNVSERPAFSTVVDIPMYGRQWQFDIRSTKAFDESLTNNKPIFILVGGIFIDALLLLIFILLTRANQRALRLAEAMTAGYESSNERLQQSNRELQRFASVAAHDLKEPLRKIQMYGEYLNEVTQTYGNEQAVTFSGRMVTAVERMRNLIDALLMYSRANSQEVSLQHIEATPLLEGVKEDVGARIADTEGTLTITNMPQILYGDDTQLYQLFLNLVGNALKFHKAGVPPVVTVDGSRSTPHQAVITVADNGIGFGKGYADQIFGVFQRLHARSEYEGTGIGLSICKRIVENHGGTIAVDSAVGEGTTFTVTLPNALHR